ncbi:uncharacterized protein LOC106658631 [Trichogramma pretiosum]|uniref:uncharacterized protein LOC106658631 n=1 Tax=Trichogramma pretiosum TaxID=7493 RepID=UPI0006C980F7|nr:uncharacterized protein LOC106658631 [Trichogramma pretiosum]
MATTARMFNAPPIGMTHQQSYLFNPIFYDFYRHPAATGGCKPTLDFANRTLNPRQLNNNHQHVQEKGEYLFSSVFGYPFNPSLSEEFDRLFQNSTSPTKSSNCDNEIWEEFKSNGKDYEYCPDQDVVPVVIHKKRNKKPLPTECVFCKNNGEDAKIYKNHLLKDNDGRIMCPILRRYTCPICKANGDKAHTIKYCPINSNKHTQQLASMNALKALRNSCGRRRSPPK